MSYSGFVFMDMELYMGSALKFLQPTLTKATLQYRHDGIPAARAYAKVGESLVVLLS